MTAPKVTVLMAVHNGLPYLQDALDSILKQTFQDFEFIVVDDASNDGSSELLRSVEDGRLRVLSNVSNQGLTKSLNIGLEHAQGDYIARMDHDDISLDTRLATQAGLLDAYPEIDVLGTWARTMGLKPEQEWHYPQEDEQIRAELLFHSVLVHSSVMWRRATFEAHDLQYDPEIARAQDYELWVRAAPHVRFANVGKVLQLYRVHPGQVGARHGGEQQDVARLVRQRQLQALGLQATADEFSLHNQISVWDFPDSLEGLQHVENWLLKLRFANQTEELYDPAAFAHVLERTWWVACSSASGLGPAAWHLYNLSPLSEPGQRTITERGRFFLKSWLAGLRS